jgi:hypothetical protein
LRDDFYREYRLKMPVRMIYYAIGGLLVAAGIALLGTLVWVPTNDGKFPAELLPFAIGLVMLGAWSFIYVSRLRVVLSSDAIVVYRAFTTKRIPRNEIVGRRVNPGGFGNRHIELFRDAKGEAALTLPLDLSTDGLMDEWLSAFVDLDASESKASLDSFLADESMMGATEDRMFQLVAAKRLARVLAWITIASLGWLIVYPRPYGIAVGVAGLLPWVAIAVAAIGGRPYSLGGARNSAEASLWEPLVAPGVALAGRALLDIQVLDWVGVIGLTLIVTLVCIGLLVWSRDSLRIPLPNLTVWILVSSYAFGASMLANQQLDQSEPTVYPTEVLNTRLVERNSTTYRLLLAPWGPRKDPAEVPVKRQLFEDAPSVEKVCVHLWRGALGVPWFEVRGCTRR